LAQQGTRAWAGGAKELTPTVVTNISARLRAKMRVNDIRKASYVLK
jgi:hypothetical protein